MAEYKIRGVGNKELNVMFGDFCYYNQHTLHERYTPLGIGLIAQYIKERFGDEVSVSIHKDVNKFLEKSAEKAAEKTEKAADKAAEKTEKAGDKAAEKAAAAF